MNFSESSDMRSATFSVLMSIYKGDDAQHLSEALNSIYELQTKKPDQIVLVIDGPIPDELKHVVDDFEGRHSSITRVLWCEKNNGLGLALKKGTELCTCDYILRMDADDLSVSDRFEKQIEYAREHPKIDAFGGYIEEFNLMPGDANRLRKVPITEQDIRTMLRQRNPMNHMSMCVKKSSLEKVGGYEPVLYCEDYFLWAKMLSAGLRLSNIPIKLVDVRVGNGFIGRRNAKERIKSWKYIQRYMLQHRMTNWWNSLVAMMAIRLFVYMPSSIKAAAYKCVLRNQGVEKRLG